MTADEVREIVREEMRLYDQDLARGLAEMIRELQEDVMLSASENDGPTTAAIKKILRGEK